MAEGEGEKRVVAPSPAAPTPAVAPEARAEEKPLIDLTDIIKARRKRGEGLGFAEALMYMQYMDNKEERAYRREQREGRGNNPTSEYEARLKALEKKSELDAALTPIKQDIKTLTNAVATLTKPPGTPTEPAGMKDINSSLTSLGKRLDGLDQRFQFTTEIQGLKTEFNSLKEVVNKGGGSAPSSAVDMIDQATKLIDKINELTRKGVGEGEFDWKAAAISTTGEIATEAIRAAKDIYSEKEFEEEETAKGEKGTISEHIIDRRLLGYLSSQLATGAKEFNTKDAAKALGLTPDQVLDSYKRLRDGGLLKQIGGRGRRGPKERTEKEETITEAEIEEEYVEG